jgi:hypothetical protein
VVFLKFHSDQDTTVEYVTDVVTGYQPNNTASQGVIWGRPVGLATDLRGNLYVGSDDITQFIAIISPETSGKKSTR